MENICEWNNCIEIAKFKAPTEKTTAEITDYYVKNI